MTFNRLFPSKIFPHQSIEGHCFGLFPMKGAPTMDLATVRFQHRGYTTRETVRQAAKTRLKHGVIMGSHRYFSDISWENRQIGNIMVRCKQQYDVLMGTVKNRD